MFYWKPLFQISVLYPMISYSFYNPSLIRISRINSFFGGISSFPLSPFSTYSNFPFYKKTNLYMKKNEEKTYSSLSSNKKKNKPPVYFPKTLNQKKYVDILSSNENALVYVLGPAGCGKTLFACYYSIQALKEKKIQKIIITRPMIAVENEELGYLPGNLVSKMDPWTRPMFDIFAEFFSPTDIQSMIHSGIIEICPLAYMRGRTFHNTFIIADEMQNSSPMQMLMLTTRIGMNSKMVVMGDLQQSDRKDKQNGLTDFLEKYRQYYPDSVYENKSNHLISIVELDSKDILRSPVVSYLLDIYNHKESKKLEQFKESKKLEKIQDLSMMDCALISKKDMEKLNKN